jgi:hypothetical protein
VTYVVTIGSTSAKAGDLGEVFEVAADLAAAAGGRDGLVVTRDGVVDEALTELAREGLRPISM